MIGATSVAARAAAPERLSPRTDRDRIDAELIENLTEAGRGFAANAYLRPLWERTTAFVLRGGKRIRPRLCLASYRVASGREPEGATWRVAAALELFHAFMLVHDDLIDGSMLRRDQLTLHEAIRRDLEEPDAPAASKRALDLGLVVGDLLAALGHRMLARAGASPAIQRAVAEVLIDTGLGEALDVFYETTPLDRITERQLLDAYLRKTSRYTVTGPLIVGALLAGQGRPLVRALRRFGDRLGLAYQLQNDLDALAVDPTLGGDHPDLDSGKRTWILWKAHRLLDCDGRRMLREALTDPVGPARRIRLWRLIQSSGALEAARGQIEIWRDEAMAALGSAPLEESQRQAYLALIGLFPGAASPADLAGKATA
ncbi:MAG: geranylgeranyl pyrophosphate synthase [Isosphaeraceae bacterium]|nr:MAG: geranylgeranyl pyrophosphate synthase [Isosphaeraceae bacterium]